MLCKKLKFNYSKLPIGLQNNLKLFFEPHMICWDKSCFIFEIFKTVNCRLVCVIFLIVFTKRFHHSNVIFLNITDWKVLRAFLSNHRECVSIEYNCI